MTYELDNKFDYIDGAKEVFERLLNILTKESSFGLWVKVKSNIANTYKKLGDSCDGKDSIEYLLKSKRACIDSLEGLSEADDPIVLANTYNNLGNVTERLSRDIKTGLEKTISYYSKALKIYRSFGMDKLYFKTSINSLKSTVRLTDYLKAEERSKLLDGTMREVNDLMPMIDKSDIFNWAVLQDICVQVLNRKKCYDEALAVYQEIFKKFNKDISAPVYAAIALNYGNLLLSKGHEDRNCETLERAIEQYNKVLKIHAETFPLAYAQCLDNRGNAYLTMAFISSDLGYLNSARSDVTEAQSILIGKLGNVKYQCAVNKTLNKIMHLETKLKGGGWIDHLIKKRKLNQIFAQVLVAV